MRPDVSRLAAVQANEISRAEKEKWAKISIFETAEGRDAARVAVLEAFLRLPDAASAAAIHAIAATFHIPVPHAPSESIRHWRP